MEPSRGRRQATGAGLHDRHARTPDGRRHEQRQAGRGRVRHRAADDHADVRARPSPLASRRRGGPERPRRWAAAAAGGDAVGAVDLHERRRDVRSLPSGRARGDRRDLRLPGEPLRPADALRHRRRRAVVVSGDQRHHAFAARAAVSARSISSPPASRIPTISSSPSRNPWVSSRSRWSATRDRSHATASQPAARRP